MDDPAVGEVVEGLPTTRASVLNELEFRQWIASLRARLAPHKELQDVVDAAQQTDGTVKNYQGTYTVTNGVITGFNVQRTS